MSYTEHKTLSAFGDLVQSRYITVNRTEIYLKFFLGYVGKVITYSDYTKDRIGAEDYTTGRLMIGMISPLKFL